MAESEIPMSPSVKEYGEPYAHAFTWHWAEVEGFTNGKPGPDTGVTCTSRGSTEMEALDRLRLDNTTIGSIRLVKVERP